MRYECLPTLSFVSHCLIITFMFVCTYKTLLVAVHSLLLADRKVIHCLYDSTQDKHCCFLRRVNITKLFLYLSHCSVPVWFASTCVVNLWCEQCNALILLIWSDQHLNYGKMDLGKQHHIKICTVLWLVFLLFSHYIFIYKNFYEGLFALWKLIYILYLILVMFSYFYNAVFLWSWLVL